MLATQDRLDKSSSEPEIGKLSDELVGFVRQAADEGRSLYEVERGIWSRVLQMGCRATEMFLRAQGNGDLGETVVTEQGQTLHRSEAPVERPLRTIFGTHVMRAYVYSSGSHEKIALRPVDARLQLSPARASYLFEEFSQYFCVDQAFGQAEKSLQMVLGQSPSVDSLERINRRVGEQAAAFLEQLPTPPAAEEGKFLVFTGDSKGVPMVKEDARRLAAFDDADGRPGNRRMATLAGVYSVDPHVRSAESVVAALFREQEVPTGERAKRPLPRFKHLRGSFVKTYDAGTQDEISVSGSFEAFCWAQTEIARRLQPEQVLVRLMDGQPSLWEAADVCLESAPADRTVDILDILHVAQYVWRAAKVFHGSWEHREAFARDRLLRILRGDVGGVIAGLRRMASQRKLRGKARREVETVCRYFTKNAARMKYDEYLRAGYPIASGVIEGACRHFVKDRMERSGMRWRLPGAQAMLDVRAVFLSSYWHEFHQSRIETEQSALHPHRHLLNDYEPTPLGA